MAAHHTLYPTSISGTIARKTHILSTVTAKGVIDKIGAFVGGATRDVEEFVSVLIARRQAHQCLGLKYAEHRLKVLCPSLTCLPVVDLADCKDTKAKIHRMLSTFQSEHALRKWYLKGNMDYLQNTYFLPYVTGEDIEDTCLFPTVVLAARSPSLSINGRIYAFSSMETLCDFMGKCLVVDLSRKIESPSPVRCPNSYDVFVDGAKYRFTSSTARETFMCQPRPQRFAIASADYSRFEALMNERKSLVHAIEAGEDYLDMSIEDILRDLSSDVYHVSGLSACEDSLLNYYSCFEQALKLLHNIRCSRKEFKKVRGHPDDDDDWSDRGSYHDRTLEAADCAAFVTGSGPCVCAGPLQRCARCA